MANKYDLDTQLWRTAGATLSTNIGGAIAAGKTRFLTYIRVERLGNVISGGNGATTLEVAVASRATGATDLADDYVSIASVYGKLILKTASIISGQNLPDDIFTKEVQGTIDNPILSVAGSNYMVLAIEESASASVFAQYYDE